jgi:hypothetical protein
LCPRNARKIAEVEVKDARLLKGFKKPFQEDFSVIDDPREGPLYIMDDVPLWNKWTRIAFKISKTDAQKTTWRKKVANLKKS